MPQCGINRGCATILYKQAVTISTQQAMVGVTVQNSQ